MRQRLAGLPAVGRDVPHGGVKYGATTLPLGLRLNSVYPFSALKKGKFKDKNFALSLSLRRLFFHKTMSSYVVIMIGILWHQNCFGYLDNRQNYLQKGMIHRAIP